VSDEVEVRTLDEAIEVLSARPLIVAAQRSVDVSSFARLGLVAGALLCEGGDAVEYAAQALGYEVCSLEPMEPRRLWSSRDIGRLAEIPCRWPSGDFVPQGSSSDEATFCRLAGHDHDLLSAPGAASSRFDDKHRMRRLLNSAGVPVPDFEITCRSDVDFEGLRRRLGSPLVFQRCISSSGIGTYLVRHDEGAPPGDDSEPWLISRWAGVRSLNFHGLASRWGPVMSAPSVQLIQEIGRRLVFSGNDFAAVRHIDRRAIEQGRQAVAAVGQVLTDGGYQGLYGVDLVVDDEGDVRVVDVNPRFQGSTWLLTELELEAGYVPMVFRHLLEFAGYACPTPVAPSVSGAQVVVHWRGKEAVDVHHDVSFGSRSWTNEDLAPGRPAVGIGDCAASEYLLTSLPPRRTTVHPGAVLGRIATRGPMTSAAGVKLDERAARIVQAVEAGVVPSDLRKEVSHEHLFSLEV
jgi:hypothetical protein